MIHIMVDYIAKMEKLLEEMRVLMNGFNPIFVQQPIPLEAIPDLSKFLEIPVAEILQRLSIRTKTIGTNLGTFGLSTQMLGQDQKL